MEQQGAFRNVQSWSFLTDPQSGQVHLRVGLGPDILSGKDRHPHELIDPGGRRLILVVSDCLSPAWYNGQMADLLATWGQKGLVAIAQMLPERLWQRTALDHAVPVQLRSRAAGTPNARLHLELPWEWFDDKPPPGMPVPVVSLEPRFLTVWAQSIAGLKGVWIPGVMLPPANGAAKSLTAVDEDTPDKPLSVEEQVKLFRATASPLAWRLAGYLAAAPLTLPVMRLVQRVMLPEARQVHLAEVFLSGLIKPEVDLDPAADPETLHYNFVEGVRDYLLSTVLISETVTVLNEVTKFVSEHTGQPLDFHALIADPTTVGPLKINDHDSTFGRVTTGVLRRLGGDYARLATHLEQGNDIPSQAVEQPVPPVGKTPEPIEGSRPTPGKTSNKRDDLSSREELAELLLRLHRNLMTLQEREAKYGGQAPLELINQIEDHKQAINLTEQALNGQITVVELKAALRPLLISANFDLDLLQISASSVNQPEIDSPTKDELIEEFAQSQKARVETSEPAQEARFGEQPTPVEVTETPQGQDIFISYSRRDLEFVHQLYSELASRGISVWFDQENIQVADHWRALIVEGIRECKIFMVILSPDAVASVNVRKEVDLAQRYQRQIVPLIWRATEIPVAMEYQLAGIQWIDFAETASQENFSQLAEVLSGLIGGTTLEELANKNEIVKASTIDAEILEIETSAQTESGRRLGNLRKRQTINPMAVGGSVISSVVTTLGLDTDDQDFVNSELKWLFSAASNFIQIRRGAIGRTQPVKVEIPPDAERSPQADNALLDSVNDFDLQLWEGQIESAFRRVHTYLRNLDILLDQEAMKGDAGKGDVYLANQIKSARLEIVKILREVALLMNQAYGILVTSPEQLIQLLEE